MRHIVLGVAAAMLVAACVSSPAGKKTSRDNAAALNAQLGIAYLQQGNLAVAKEKLERAEKQNPKDPNVHSALALLYERMGNREEADSHYRTAMRLAPQDPDVSNNYAVYLCRSGRTEEGVQRFQAAAQNPLYRTPDAAYTNAGVCLRNVGRHDEAAANFQRALRIRPSSAEAAFQLGDLELNRGRLNDANAQVAQYLAAFDATPDLLLLGVRTARALGDQLGAAKYARRLRLEFPGSQQVRALDKLDQKSG